MRVRWLFCGLVFPTEVGWGKLSVRMKGGGGEMEGSGRAAGGDGGGGGGEGGQAVWAWGCTTVCRCILDLLFLDICSYILDFFGRAFGNYCGIGI